MFTCSAAGFLLTFTEDGGHIAGCQISEAASWLLDWPQPFPDELAIPILGATGMDDTIVLIDNDHQLWACEIPGGGWVQNIAPPSEFNFTIASFLGASGDCIAAVDTAGNGWVIQSSTNGGQWASAKHVLPLP